MLDHRKDLSDGDIVGMIDGAIGMLTHWSKGSLNQTTVEDWTAHEIFELADEVIQNSHAATKTAKQPRRR